MEEKIDYGATNRFLIKHAPELAVARKYITPATLGSAITGFAIVISLLVNAQRDLRTAQSDIQDLKETVGGLVKKVDTEINTEKQNDVPVAVTASRVEGIENDVARLQQWQDRVNGIAETPSHARRRR